MGEDNRDDEYYFHNQVRAITSCSPGIRTVIVRAIIERDPKTGNANLEVCIDSVLAIVTEIYDTYDHECKEGDKRPSSASLDSRFLEKAGWHHTSTETRSSLHVLTVQGDLRDYRSWYGIMGWSCMPVVCNWPPESDIDFLKEAKACVIADAKTRHEEFMAKYGTSDKSIQ